VIAAVHALIGAVVGRWIGQPATAFAAGIVTHAMGDVLPHRDLKITTEAPLLAAALGVIAWRCGVGSPELAGAAGAVLPDVENGAWMIGLLPRDRVIFPTHVGNGKFHGPEAQSAWPQAPLALACLVLLLSGAGDGKSRP
jgi:hypothetical protein